MLCRNERVSEDGQLPDGIQLKDVNILTFYKLFGISFRNESHFKSAMCLSGLALVNLDGTCTTGYGRTRKEERTAIHGNKTSYTAWL